MSTLRAAVTSAVVVMMCIGYACSQAAFFNGRAAEYAAAVDQPPVRIVSGILLAAMVLACFWRDHSERSDAP